MELQSGGHRLGGARNGVWGVSTLTDLGRGMGREIIPHQKKNSLQKAYLGAFLAVFLFMSSPEKMFNFPQLLVLLWTLKVHFREVVNTLSEL